MYNIVKTYSTSILITLVCMLFAIECAKAQKSSSNFKNAELLDVFFTKLAILEFEKKGKINIVHIGDSHVQADFFTDAIRQPLQQRFGNAGYGFTFPYSLAKTNGTSLVRYKSDIIWQSLRNVFPVSDILIGLGGIALYSNSDDFTIDLDVSNKYAFTKLKILYPFQKSCFSTSLTQDFKTSNEIEYIKQEEKPETSTHSEPVYHRIKRGETLYRVSVNYNVSVDELKKINNLTSNIVKIDQKLIIPNSSSKIKPKQNQTAAIPIKRQQKITKADSLSSVSEPYISVYSSKERLNSISIRANKSAQKAYNLSGIILESDTVGLIYHSIGVNGAKTSDYNKYPLFYKQLDLVKPDLVVISLGTNESFGQWSTARYINQMKIMVENIRQSNPDLPIIIMTPPPSLFSRKNVNNLVGEYAKALMEIKNCVIWDMLHVLGGTKAPLNKELSPLMARDKIHFTKDGYQYQGQLFYSDFSKTYDKFLKDNNLGNINR